MDRRTAIESLANLAPSVTTLDVAREIARSIDWGVDLDLFGLHPDKIVGRVRRGGVWYPGVSVARLGAEIALHFGLYGSLDHAMATPFAPQFEGRTQAAKYQGERAAMRLAYHFFGREGVEWLHERCPQLDKYVLREASDPFFLRTARPGRTPTGGN